MTPPEDARDRKAEHIRIALQDRVQHRHNFFDDYRFRHLAFPEIALDDVDLSVEFLGQRLSSPLLVSCMTGGTEEAARINQNLAIAAERTGVALGVGSQRKALEEPSLASTFRVRPWARSVPVLANLGAVQLNHGFGLEECEAAVRMIDADALVFHLNPLQEAIQPEGQTDFRSLIRRVGEVARVLSVPVVVKEVGSGIGADVAARLMQEGIHIVDTAGLGGTSWALIEAERAGDQDLGDLFADWGIPTPEAIAELGEVVGLTVIGSGGVRSGLDVAKCLALGAHLVGMAQPFLKAALESPERVVEQIQHTTRELKIVMFCVGARTVPELRQAVLERRPR